MGVDLKSEEGPDWLAREPVLRSDPSTTPPVLVHGSLAPIMIFSTEERPGLVDLSDQGASARMELIVRTSRPDDEVIQGLVGFMAIRWGGSP